MEATYITFTSLSKTHFPLLLKWLETSHVKAWWDQDVKWTPELIEEKYGSYTQGYKICKGIKKPLQAYLFSINQMPAGYIQLYNAYDFPREHESLPKDMPGSLAAIDFFIGEPGFIGKGFAPLVLVQFLEGYVRPTYKACFVDPDQANERAIKAYAKAGFQPIYHPPQGKDIWMIKEFE